MLSNVRIPTRHGLSTAYARAAYACQRIGRHCAQAAASVGAQAAHSLPATTADRLLQRDTTTDFFIDPRGILSRFDARLGVNDVRYFCFLEQIEQHPEWSAAPRETSATAHFTHGLELVPEDRLASPESQTSWWTESSGMRREVFLRRSTTVAPQVGRLLHGRLGRAHQYEPLRAAAAGEGLRRPGAGHHQAAHEHI